MKRHIILATLAAGMLFTSCDSYLDINESPNSPSSSAVTTNLQFPACEMHIAASYGDYLRIVGGYFAQHYAQDFGTSNYLDYSQFTMSATRSSGTYMQLTSRALKNLKTVSEKAASSEEWGTYLAAATLRAFAFQVLVDCYGEVPYSEALDESIVAPHYDEGQTIYSGILAELDEALAKASESDPVATNFLYTGETAGSWIKFANALKLRILMRESGVADVDSEIAALIAEDNFPTEDVAFDDCWSNSTGSMNPFFFEEISTDNSKQQSNVVLNLALLATMQQKDSEGTVTYDDPRLATYFLANEDAGEYTGGLSGSNFSTSSSYKASYWCRPNVTYSSPVYLINVFETEFFIAEYYAKKGNTAQATAHYNAAIEASFATMGVSGADDYIAAFPFDSSNYAKSIGVAKWVALAGTNNFEAWCELRRLDYPAFGSVQGSDLYNLSDDSSYKPELLPAGTLYTPIQVFGQVGQNHLLERFPYPEYSTARNSNAPEFPGYTEPVFWAK